MTRMELVANNSDLAASCLSFTALSESGNLEDLRYFKKRLKNTKRFVALALGTQSYLFAPGGYVAYHGRASMQEWNVICETKRRSQGRDHLDKLLQDAVVSAGHPLYAELTHEYLDYCRRWQVTPSAHHRAVDFWLLSATDSGMSYPDEVVEPTIYYEGTRRRVEVNSYERDADARAACIAHYGNRYACEICGFNFGDAYGSLGNQYIHVHHLVPLSTIGQSYKVNPKKDLIPVCCNCHAMIHRRKGSTLSPEELSRLVKCKTAI